MGVRGLWDILAPAAENKSLAQFAIDGYVAGRGLVVGIDASLWFHHAQQPFLVGHWRAGENPELRVIFHRLAHLATLPLIPLFVFDGPKRPSSKRGKHITPSIHWLEDAFRSLAEAFGFNSHIAPGEAEAELAMLNRAHIIDAIFTDDVDALVFGAETVVRGTSNRKNQANISIYRSQNILDHHGLQLSTNALVLMAVLCGGDYDPVGLEGCGPELALELARCGYGDRLRNAIDDESRIEVKRDLLSWQMTLRWELRKNHHHRLRRRHPKVAYDMRSSFPNQDIVRLYISPVTSPQPFPPSSPLLSIGQGTLDVAAIAALCENQFGWGIKNNISECLRSKIAAAAASRAIQEGTRVAHTPSALVTKLNNMGLQPLKILRQRQVQDTGHATELEVKVNADYFAQAMTSGPPLIRQSMQLPGATFEQSNQVAEPFTSDGVWVLAAVIESFDARAVADYLETKKPTKKKSQGSISNSVRKKKSHACNHHGDGETIDLTV